MTEQTKAFVRSLEVHEPTPIPELMDRVNVIAHAKRLGIPVSTLRWEDGQYWVVRW